MSADFEELAGYARKNDRIRELEAENTLMNELISDQQRDLEELQEQVNRLAAVLVKMGMTPTEVRNLVDG